MRISVRMSGDALESLAKTRANMPKAFLLGCDRVLIEATRQIPLQIKPGKSLTPRSGGLGKSWVPRFGAELKVRASAFGARGYLASNHPAARIQNVGGTVTPVKAQNLAIPLKAAKTPAGVSRFASPREVRGLFRIVSKAGNVLLVRRKGYGKSGTKISGGRIVVATRQNAALELWYLLVKSARIPASNYLDKAEVIVEAKAPGIVDATLQEAINKGARS